MPGGAGAAIVANATNTSSGGTETSGRTGGGGGGNISHSGPTQQVITTGSTGAGSGGDGSGGGGGGASGGGGGGSTAVARHRPKKPSGASSGSHHGGMQSGATSSAGGSKSEYAGGGGSSGKVKGVGGSASGLGGSPFQGGAQVPYGALVDGGIPSADEVLGDVNMSWQFWHAMVGITISPFIFHFFLWRGELALIIVNSDSMDTFNTTILQSFPLSMLLLFLRGDFHFHRNILFPELPILLPILQGLLVVQMIKPVTLSALAFLPSWVGSTRH